MPPPPTARIVSPMPRSGRFISAAWLIATLTLGSRILGLLRECIFSYYFSTTELLSAFRIAFMAPNLARRLFGEGALSSAMIPVLTDSLEKDGVEPARRLVGSLLSILAIVLVALILIVEAVISIWRNIRDDAALELAAILMPYLGLICMVAIVSSVLHVRGHFATPAAVPMILNLGLIGAILFAAMDANASSLQLMYAACGGVLVAGAIQLLAVSVALRAKYFSPIFGGAWRDPQIRRVGTLMGPMVLGLAAVQINSLVDYLIAYWYVSIDGQRGGPAILGYAQYLYQLPLGVFGIAIATAIFPVLAQRASANDRSGVAETFARGIRLSLFLALPASVGLLFVAHPLVATLYERGKFDAADTQRVAMTLFFYAIGVGGYFAQHILVRTFYALQDSKTPARVSLVMVGVNFAMNMALVFVMEERGLALATAVCGLTQAAWLARGLAILLPEISWRPIIAGVLRLLWATTLMAGVLAALTWHPAARSLYSGSTLLELVVLVAGGVTTYVIAGKVLRINELRSVLH